MTTQTPKRTTIAIDIDDVVANIIDSVRLWANATTGATLTPEDYCTTDDYWNYYDSIWQRHGLHEQLNFKMVLDGLVQDQSHIELVTGTREAIQALRTAYDLVFVTSRPLDQREATRQWLDTHVDAGIPMYSSHNPDANQEGRSKGEICADLGAVYLIDDNVNNCQNAAEYGVEPLLFGAYGWNSDAPAQLKRYTSWSAVREYCLMKPDSEFRQKVEALMAQVPAGQVTTYGDLAALAGHPYAARIVGGMAHYGDTELPWHRLVNRFGGLASGYYGVVRFRLSTLRPRA